MLCLFALIGQNGNMTEFNNALSICVNWTKWQYDGDSEYNINVNAIARSLSNYYSAHCLADSSL
jgi:hypothetical protein